MRLVAMIAFLIIGAIAAAAPTHCEPAGSIATTPGHWKIAQRPEDVDAQVFREASKYYDKAREAWSQFKNEEALSWLERALKLMPYDKQILAFHKDVKSRTMRHKSLFLTMMGKYKEAHQAAIEGLMVDDTEPVIIRNLRQAEARMESRAIPYERFVLPQDVERCYSTYEANVAKCSTAFCEHNQMKLYELCVGRPVGSTDPP